MKAAAPHHLLVVLALAVPASLLIASLFEPRESAPAAATPRVPPPPGSEIGKPGPDEEDAFVQDIWELPDAEEPVPGFHPLDGFAGALEQAGELVDELRDSAAAPPLQSILDRDDPSARTLEPGDVGYYDQEKIRWSPPPSLTGNAGTLDVESMTTGGEDTVEELDEETGGGGSEGESGREDNGASPPSPRPHRPKKRLPSETTDPEPSTTEPPPPKRPPEPPPMR